MSRSGSKTVKILAFTLALVVLLSAIPAGVFSALKAVERAPLQVAVMADIHYFPQSLMGDKGKAWKEYCDSNACQNIQCKALLDSALYAIEKHAKDNGCKYVLIPGDLTKDSEYAGHTELAARLEQFEKETGIQVLVINGNHDINNSGATTFENNRAEKARATTPENFKNIYKNLGYDLAYHTYTPPAGEKAGMLSYSAKLDGGYRLIAIDASKYSSDSTSDGENEHETGGNIPPSLMKWVLNEIADANRCGETVVGLIHHSLAPQFDIEPTVFQAFMVDNWLETTETLTDAGMHFAFTGHMHVNNLASHVSDKGETLYDCSTSSLTGYPNVFREVLFDNTGKSVKATYKTLDVDCEKQVIADGTAYQKPYKNTFSFGQTYGNDGLASFGVDMAEGFLENIFKDIQAEGGLLAYLTANGIDLAEIINSALKGGLVIGDTEIFTTKNIMAFIKDLANQIDINYIDNPAKVMEIINWVAKDIINMKVSDYPCTNYIDTLGFGNPDKPGTLQDAAYSVIAHLYQGDEDISNDIFTADFLDFFKNRNGAKVLYNTLIDVVVNDLIEGEILANLDFNPKSLFPKGSFGQIIGVFLTGLIDVIFAGNNSFGNIIESTLSVLPEKYNSVEDILNFFTSEYLTQSQFDSIGFTISEMLGCLVTDTDPGLKKDNNATVTYSGPVPVTPTVDDYRLPSQIAVTFGNKTDSTRNISWFTKYSVTNTDIEIVPYSENPVFTGVPTEGAGISAKSEKATRSIPGADLGITGFLKYNFTLIRHTVKLSCLKTGTKYCYRVGDASKGWWSRTGVIETADNSDKVTFFHMTDPQSQNEHQYETWANVVDTAFNMYPQSKFIMSTGDLTDNPSNIKQWKWLLNTAYSDLMSTVLMPTTGNHEDENYALDQSFALPDAPEQNRSTGIYYSFDYNNVHFIVLNTNDLNAKNALSDKQLAWLKQDAAASSAQWKIVALHKALYSNGSHYDDKDVKAIRKQLCSLMPELGIDLVLQGHDHVYLRTNAMKGNKVVLSQTKTVTYNGLDYKEKIEPKGSIYVISACAGVKYYLPKKNIMTDMLFPRAQSIVSVEVPVFSAIQIDGNKLYFDAYSVNGDKTQRIDSFAVEKAAVSASVAAANSTALQPAAVPAKTSAAAGGISVTVASFVPDKSDAADNETSAPAETTAAEPVTATESATRQSNTVASYEDTAVPQTGGKNYTAIAVVPALFAACVFISGLRKRKTEI